MIVVVTTGSATDLVASTEWILVRVKPELTPGTDLVAHLHQLVGVDRIVTISS